MTVATVRGGLRTKAIAQPGEIFPIEPCMHFVDAV
eukprot:SAG31_NODE_35894_length_318_cov_1.182648_1_plen_34_part_01